LNPKTGCFVLKSGAIGMRILLGRAGIVRSESEESEESDGDNAGVPVRKLKV
jgi:hypothetical protein